MEKSPAILITFFIAAFLSIACNEPFVKSKDFGFYLKQEHGIEIPQELHYYFIIPPVGCKSCTNQTRAWLHADSMASNVTCIDLVSDDRQGMVYTSGGSGYLMDDYLDIRQYTVDIGSLTLIRTRNRNIDSIFQLNATNMYDVVKQEKILRGK